MTRFSSAGSAAAVGASLANTEPASMTPSSRTGSLRSSIQLLYQRQYLVAYDLRGDDADTLVANHTGLVDDIGFGNAVYAVIDADAAVAIIGGKLIGIAEARQPGNAVGALVFVIEA